MPWQYSDDYSADVPQQDDARQLTLSEHNAELLRQFEAWLRASESEAAISPASGDSHGDEPGVGLYQLHEVLASQRHELKLYTKSGRQTQELLARCIEETSAAVVLLQRYHRDKPDIERKAVKPFLLSLIEIDESLERATVAVQTIQERLMDMFGTYIERSAAVYCDRLTFWGRLRRRKIILEFTVDVIREQQAEMERVFQPFRDGFEMLRRRMNDVLKKHAIQRIDPRGEPVNPETMQVIAVVESETVTPGHVADVVRPGYLWRGKPIRFADVRAAR